MASFLTVLLLAHSKPILSLVFVAMTRAAGEFVNESNVLNSYAKLRLCVCAWN